MIKKKYVVYYMALLLFPVWSMLAVSADVPYLSGRVTDNAEILNPETAERLSTKLKSHETQTTNQIVILTLPTLEGEDIESFALRVFEEWKLGQKGKDNGVLLVIVPNDRRMRIEVGYGLEGTLTDLKAGRIIRNIMTPRFKKNDFNGGIEQGVLAIISQLEGAEELPAMAEPSEAGEVDLKFEGPDLGIIERILIGAFVFGIIGLFTVLGVLTPRVGWFLYFFLIPFWAMFPIVVVGANVGFILLITYLIVFPVLKLILGRTKWYRQAGRDLKTKGRARIGGFTFGGSGSSSWNSSGSSFSGGGGSSGGGGASGSW